MLDPVSLFTLLLVGFLGGGHCLGMCGGLSSALALQLPPHIGRFKLLLLLNLGRISSYIAVGVLLGALGQASMALDHTRGVQTVLALAANGLLLLLGLYLAGLSAWITRVETLGRPLWRRLNPLLGRLLPIRSTAACLAAGALWGWLPCGLVYSASLYALSSGNAFTGGLYLAAFGLGTLPNLLAIGLFAEGLKRHLQRRPVRLLTGLGIAAWAVWQLWQLAGNIWMD